MTGACECVYVSPFQMSLSFICTNNEALVPPHPPILHTYSEQYNHLLQIGINKPIASGNSKVQLQKQLERFSPKSAHQIDLPLKSRRPYLFILRAIISLLLFEMAITHFCLVCLSVG